MTVQRFCQHLAALLPQLDPALRLEIVAVELALFFGVEEHEVAYFKIDSAGRMATFCWPPPQFGQLGNIPLKSLTTSLLAATAREKKGFCNNAFAATPHLHMFERMLADTEQRVAVQKIISVPLLQGEQAKGVLQVSRKGLNLASAGADFSAADLQNLETIARTLAPITLT